MQDFRLNYIKNKYGDKTGMLSVDNDSLMYKIEAEMFMNTSTKIKNCLT